MFQTKPFNRIYHYCKLSTAIEYILAKKELLLSPLGNTNDPRETKALLFSAIYSGTDKSFNISEKNKQITEILRSDCKQISFSEDYSKSFWGFEYARMWAFYGDNHKGVCLQLAKDEFLEENKHIINPDLLRKINYYQFDIDQYSNPIAVDYITMEEMPENEYLRTKFRPEHLENLYFTKNQEWESEHELRLIHFSEKEEKEYCSIKNSLKNIILGADFFDSYLPSLIKLCPNTTISKLEFTGIKLTPKEIYSPQ